MLSSPKGGLFAGRFEIEREAGSGGTGSVYRARDHFTGDIVALKILHTTTGSNQEAERFAREAQLLSDLCHPGIVAYVAHGTTSDGQCYLAMEWLEGEDLSKVLARGPLSPTDALGLMGRVAEALAVAHRRNVVHRDLKPTNLFIPGGRLEQVKLLDFGIARRAMTMANVTRSGMLVGTPAYMAPEQAHGSRQVSPATDVFSLGCVLYECLTGRPPFLADHVAAVLARVLFDEPTPVRELRPEVPPVLEQLIGRMLTKDSAQRPPDAGALLEDLRRIEPLLSQADAPSPSAVTTPTPAGLSSRADSDQILVNVVLAVPTVSEGADGSRPWVEPTRPQGVAVPPMERHPTLRAALADMGVQCEWLLDGSLVVTLAAHGYATDQVARAAQVALTIRQLWRGSQVVLTTGLGAAKQNILLGNAVNRAAKLMRDRELITNPTRTQPSAAGAPADDNRRTQPDHAGSDATQPTSAPTHARGGTATDQPVESGVWVDELSARLLERYYRLKETPEGLLLTESQQSPDEARMILGKATACVGRDQELSTLDIVLDTCIDESTAKLVLVTGPAGYGKSRLRHEFLRRLASRDGNVTVIHGRAELLSKGSAFAVLSQALRQMCDVRIDQSPAQQQARLSTRLVQHLSGTAESRARIVSFLGEMCGVPFQEETDALLKAARQDPKIMKDRVTQAFVDFIGSECAVAPVLLIIEDLHWGDSLTVSLLETTLRQHADRPLLILILARPEVHELFPRLAKVFGTQELVLKGLSKKAGERLVHQVLGKQIAPVVVDALLRMSDGNPLFLEELIRSTAEQYQSAVSKPVNAASSRMPTPTPAPAPSPFSRSLTMAAATPSPDSGKSGHHRPVTVLAMLQARLSHLDPSARRVLRAASVFGLAFWRGGVAQLLGPDADGLDRWLEHLVAMEHIEKHRDSHIAHDVEYGFRNALLREAVYSLLTEYDRRAGHLAAAHFLHDVGETESQVLAEHFQLGGDVERAADCYLRAAEQAYGQLNVDGMLHYAQLGLACGSADAEARSTLQAIACIGHAARLDWTSAVAAGDTAVAKLPLGSLWWCRAIEQLFAMTPSLEGGHGARAQELIELFARARPSRDAITAYAAASANLIAYTAFLGDRDHAFAFLIFLETLAEPLRRADLLLNAWTASAQGWFCHSLESDLQGTLQHAQTAVKAFEQAQAQHGLCRAQILQGLALASVGAYVDGEAAVRSGYGLAQQIRDASLSAFGQAHLAWVLSLRNDEFAQDEALLLAERALAEPGDAVTRGMAHLALARVHMLRNRAERSLETCEAAAQPGNAVPLYLLAIQAVRCDALVALGRAGQAIEIIERAIVQVDELGGAGWTEVPVRVAAVAAHIAAGQRERARAQLALAEAQIETRAAGISDTKQRMRYLANAVENLRAQRQADELNI